MTNLIHIPMNGRAFVRWSEGRGLRDTESAAHALVTGIFGRKGLEPFRVFEADAGWSLYGYSAQGAEALRQVAEMTATPDMLEVLNLAALRGKPMPAIAAGARIGFDLRFRPTRRSKVGERDAFDVERARGSNRDRQASYCAWLAERLQGAAEIENFRLIRSDHARTYRKGRPATLAEATAHGTVTVSDAVNFAALLAGGVGRHGSYGMGMLLLRPADPQSAL